MSELMESLEARMLLAGNPLEAPEVPIAFANVEITLRRDEAPRAVRSFLELRDQGKLNNVIVHRNSPGSNSARSGLFRTTEEGLEYVPKTKRIDEVRSLRTTARTVAFMRDPDHPRRTTGEIVFNKVDRPGARRNMIVFGTYRVLDPGDLYFDLRDQVEVERADLLESVPADFGSTFDEVRYHRLGLGQIDGTTEHRRLGAFASSASAEWVTIHNSGSEPEIFEVQIRASDLDGDLIAARGVVPAGKTRLVQLHIGEELDGVDRLEFFGRTRGEVILANGVRTDEPYAVMVHTAAPGLVRLQRLESTATGEIVPTRLTESGFSGFSTFRFPPLDLDNGGANSRIALLNTSTGDASIQLSAINEFNETVEVTVTLPAGRAGEIRLDAIDALNGKVVKLDLRSHTSRITGLFVDGRKDFVSTARSGTIDPGIKILSFEQLRLQAGSKLQLYVFNLPGGTSVVTPELSLVRCDHVDNCPDNPPDVPELDPFSVPIGGFASFPIDGEALTFERDYFVRLTSRAVHGALRKVHFYFDPRELEDL